MPKFFGNIGFAEAGKTAPGVWTEKIVVKSYSGDIIKNIKRYETGEGLNDNLTINVRISIISDPYADANLGNIRYVELGGSKWKVKDIDEIQRPRVTLTLGGVYNG